MSSIIQQVCTFSLGTGILRCIIVCAKVSENQVYCSLHRGFLWTMQLHSSKLYSSSLFNLQILSWLHPPISHLWCTSDIRWSDQELTCLFLGGIDYSHPSLIGTLCNRMTARIFQSPPSPCLAPHHLTIFFCSLSLSYSVAVYFASLSPSGLAPSLNGLCLPHHPIPS